MLCVTGLRTINMIVVVCCAGLCLASLFLFSVLSGDLWSGSENGALKIWPWEAVEEALSEKRPMAVSTVERSFIDLRSQLSVNGFSSMLTADIRNLLSDTCSGKVWSAGFQSFALWYVIVLSCFSTLNIGSLQLFRRSFL